MFGPHVTITLMVDYTIEEMHSPFYTILKKGGLLSARFTGGITMDRYRHYSCLILVTVLVGAIIVGVSPTVHGQALCNDALPPRLISGGQATVFYRPEEAQDGYMLFHSPAYFIAHTQTGNSDFRNKRSRF